MVQARNAEVASSSPLLDGENPRRRRAMPSAPRIAIPNDVAPDRRLTYRYVWAPQQPQLAWMLYWPKPEVKLVHRRLTHWSYQLGYGGFLICYLFPHKVQARAALETWRWSDEAAADEAMKEAATVGAQTAQRLRVRTIIAATGDLDREAGELMRTWLIAFEEVYRVREWVCLDKTPAGWPAAPAVSGRAPLPPMPTLYPWRYPAIMPRRSTISRAVRRHANAAVSASA